MYKNKFCGWHWVGVCNGWDTMVVYSFVFHVFFVREKAQEVGYICMSLKRVVLEKVWS